MRDLLDARGYFFAPGWEGRAIAARSVRQTLSRALRIHRSKDRSSRHGVKSGPGHLSRARLSMRFTAQIDHRATIGADILAPLGHRAWAAVGRNRRRRDRGLRAVAILGRSRDTITAHRNVKPKAGNIVRDASDLGSDRSQDEHRDQKSESIRHETCLGRSPHFG